MRDDFSSGGYDKRAFVAEFYDIVPAYVARADAPFYLALAAKARGSILELGCGTGRLLIPIARAGHRIVGLDLADAMLERCRAKLAREPQAVQDRATIVRADITKFSLPDRFDLAIAPFRCFQHLIRVGDQIECLKTVARHLKRSGTLVLDLFQVQAARMHDPIFLNESVEFEGLQLADGRTLGRSFRTAAFHRSEQYNDVELIYYVTHPDGRSERLVHEFPFRYFFRYEIEHLLERCGFRAHDVFGNYDRSPLTDESPEMIFVAEKKRRTD